MKLTDHIENIVQHSRDSKLSSSQLKHCSSNIEALSAFMNCSEKQALLFAIILHNSLESGSADLGDIAGHFGITVMQVLRHKPDLDALVKTRFIRMERNDNPFSHHRNISWFVHPTIIDSVLKCKLSGGIGKIDNNYELMRRLMETIETASEQAGGCALLAEDMFDLCKRNSSLPLAQKILNSNLMDTNLIILIFVAYKLINGEDEVAISDACEFLGDDKHRQLLVRRELMSGKNKLLERGLLELVPGMFRNDSELTITEKGLEYLLGQEAEEFSLRTTKAKREILHDKIPPVKLFLNKSEQQQLNTLKGLFLPAKFLEISQRMHDNSMKPGFSVLLFGSPGTGKTESVYQLARETGRSILPVEISSAKSMWFGESEKLIKGIFEHYQKLHKGSNIAPILLFNEADGIFGKRSTNLDSSVSQTLNAMQNIILQEMEDFEGIMVATTNLTENLDPAFDRRFLYKIKFDIPNLNTRLQIMQEKIPFLPPEAIRQLCEQYKLTGGQMANIAKKCNIYELLEGTQPGSPEVGAFCREELGLKEKVKLGF
ncbi:MAG: AAA family ATPase [Bacteroidales bacterium]|nr:AAA family ATPase [Bacteroidales bacterium]